MRSSGAELRRPRQDPLQVLEALQVALQLHLR